MSYVHWNLWVYQFAHIVAATINVNINKTEIVSA